MLFSKSAHPGKLNLLCFPFAGGSADFYNRWSSPSLNDTVVHPIRLPGRGQLINLPLISNMPLLIDLIINELYRFRDCRFALLGTSMGGWLALQLAQELKRRESLLQPECLVICSTAHPAFRKHLPQIENIDPSTAIRRLGEFNPSCLVTLKNPELASLFLPILQADFTLCRTWQFNSNVGVNCPIWAFHAHDDHIVDYSMMLPWKNLTCGAFQMTRVDGDHFFTEHPSPAFLEQLHHLLHVTQRQPLLLP